MPKTGFAFPAMASLPIADVVEVAQAAEAQGYESFWLTEGANRDSISQLAYLAAKTSRIKLGTGIITIFSRTPVMVAQTAAGMMELSGGRFILGLGTGHKASVERVQGQVFSKPASRTRDYIRIIREALKGERVSYQGEVVSVSDFRFGGPLPAGELPIYIACLGGPLARVSGEMADGVVPLMASPQGIEKLWEGIAEGAAQAGRDPSKVDVAGFIVACASDDHAQAEAEARRQIARYGSLPFYQRMMRIGGFEEEVEKIVQAQAAGGEREDSRAGLGPDGGIAGAGG